MNKFIKIKIVKPKKEAKKFIKIRIVKKEKKEKFIKINIVKKITIGGLVNEIKEIRKKYLLRVIRHRRKEENFKAKIKKELTRDLRVVISLIQKEKNIGKKERMESKIKIFVDAVEKKIDNLSL